MLSPHAIEQAYEALTAGKVAILSTDTVPGLFALDTPRSEQILKELKGRDEGKPTARMFGSRKQILQRVRVKNEIQIRALERLMPGRITVVFPSLVDGEPGIGTRLPMDSSLRALIRLTGPLLATSANFSGRDSEVIPGELIDKAGFVDESVLIQDNSLRVASTVIDLEAEKPIILRKGAVPIWSIALRLHTTPYLPPPLMLNIIFVCGGNTCRSPMAEAIFSATCFSERVAATSAGLSALEGEPAAANAREIVEELGLSLSHHRSKVLSEALVYWADLVLVMTREQLLRVRREYGQFAGRIFLLSGFPEPWPRGHQIEDPIGRSKDIYRATALEISSSIETLNKEIGKLLKL